MAPAKGIPGRNNYYTHKDQPDVKLCKKCTGTGRGERVEGQNFPPIVPEGSPGDFEDGDFGLWFYNEDGEFVTKESDNMLAYQLSRIRQSPLHGIDRTPWPVEHEER